MQSPPTELLGKSRVRVGELFIHGFLALCALVSVLTTAGIIWVLVSESWHFFQQVSPIAFLTGTVWEPYTGAGSFGVLPLICGTVLIAGGALLVGVPIGLGVAVFMSEYAPPWFRSLLKPVLEVLAGIPTVVYGYFALTFVTPNLIQTWVPTASTFNGASAAIVVGIMIIPTIASLCDDAFRAVPRTLREAAYALSATKVEVTLRIVLPAAASGVAAACILALGRAVGETMAVALAAGSTPAITLNPFRSLQTMTGYIVQVQTGDASHGGTPAFRSLYAVGLLLFLMTLGLNLLSTMIGRRFREKYE
ncbi:MAG: phosphate ABC transporter permease subunit PstC [Phycisphaerae bacterium]|nr:phosphate ABC transporter permease subunit PstC [Phycisphaerae bacterium]